MKISQEVRDFARLNPSPLGGEGDSPAASGERETPLPPAVGAGDGPVISLEQAEAGMAEMSERYRDWGGFVRGRGLPAQQIISFRLAKAAGKSTGPDRRLTFSL